MASSQGVVLFGRGPHPKSLPGNIGQTDGRTDGVVHSGAPPGLVAAHQRHPTPVTNGPQTDSEIREVVVKLRNGHAAGATEMKAQHLKEWLRSTKCEEAEDSEEGAGSCWRLFVSLIKAVWECGTVPTQMSWMVTVLLSKGGGGGGLPWYWLAQPHVEGCGEDYGSPSFSHSAP